MSPKVAEYEVTVMDIKSIDCHDTTFHTRWDDSIPESLEKSIAAHGVLQPLIVHREENTETYKIISGFRRARAALKCHIEHVPCVILTIQVDSIEGLLLNLEHHRHLEPLNPVDKALFLSKAGAYLGREEIIATILPLLNLPPREEVFSNYLALNDLIAEFKKETASEAIPLNLAFRITSLKTETQSVLAKLFDALRLTVSLKKEFLDMLEEISARDDTSIPEILKSPEVSEILVKENIPPQKKTERIRYELKKRRYPTLTTLEAQFDEFSRSLNLPPQISLTPAPYFEGNTFHLTIDFTKKETLTQGRTIIERVSDRFAELKNTAILE